MSVRCLPRGLHSFLRHSLGKRLPESLSVHSAVRLIDNGPLDGFQVWTDNWPDFSAVLVSADKTRNPYLQKLVMTYCEHAHGLQQIVMHKIQKRTLDVSTILLSTASPESETVIDAVFYDINGYWPDPITPNTLYKLPANRTISHCTLPEGIREGVLNEEAVIAANTEWKFSEPGTLELMESTMLSGKMQNVCLYNKENLPIAWAMEQVNLSIGMLVVISKFRRYGLGKYVILRLAEKLKARGCRVYVDVEKDNLASQKMFQDSGFQVVKYPCSEYIWKQYCHNNVA